MNLFQKLRILLTRRDKIILLLLIPTTFFISVLEIAFLSATMLFITLITNFESIPTNKYYLLANSFFSSQITPAQALLIFGSILIAFFLFRCSFSFYYTYYLSKFSQTRYHAIAFRFFQNYFSFNYQQFTSKNSSAINKLIFYDAIQMTNIISASLFLFSEIFTVFLIYTSLVYINWKMTLVLTLLLTLKVTFLLKTFSRKLKKEATKLNILQTEIGKIFRESFGNFKLIKLISNEQALLDRFNKANYEIVQAQTINTTLQNTPRLFLETMGFSLLVGSVMYVVYRIDTPQYVIPILSMYALAFYRFMPSVTRIMNFYNQIIFAKNSIDQSNLLFYKTEKLGNQKISFEHCITLQNLSFCYQEDKNILHNINLTIRKGETVAFIGESGVGKSTISDIIMGLHKPQSGEIFIDSNKLMDNNLKSWRNKIGYIPQSIYLFDGTIAENIVFGRNYDEQKIITVLKKANLYDFLLTQESIHTKVGEEGIRLSGGQKQRVAIARALYSDPEILILDEATSALDNETEEKIVEEIYNINKDKTLIIIAHRLTTVLRCETIYKIEKQQIIPVNKQLIIDQITQSSNTHQLIEKQG